MNYSCEAPEPCTDKLPQKKCKKCNKKKCKKTKNCKKNCQKTCDLCDDPIIAFYIPPRTPPILQSTPPPLPKCGKLNGPSGTIQSEGYPESPSSGADNCQWTIKCGQAGGNKNLIVKSEVGYQLNYSCEAPEPCEDKWPQKKCKKCNKKKCKKSKRPNLCKMKCEKTCDVCGNRSFAFYN